MNQLSPSPVWGATLFATPGMRTAGHFSAALTIVILLIMVVVPLVLYGRGPSKPKPPDTDPGDGWGNRPKQPQNPPRGPKGGIPLDDAAPARVRLRGNDRLADLLPTRSRRPAREPDRRPVRETTLR